MPDRPDTPPWLRADGRWREQLRETFETTETLLVLTDFDGTLAEITDEPDAASIRADARAALSRLSAAPDVRVGVVSGRALADVRSRVGLDGVAYAGNHGLEIEVGERRFVHPAAEEAEGDLEELCERLRDRLAGVEGAMVEEKGLSATVHYRRVKDGEIAAGVRNTVRSFAGEYDDSLRVSDGKQILELRPDVDWDKGRAVEWLRESLDVDRDRSHTIFLGDDVTDEAAFLSLGIGTAISVGSTAETADTGADYRLADPAAVAQFLEWLAGVRRGD